LSTVKLVSAGENKGLSRGEHKPVKKQGLT
jgi:hypothetical protein